MPFPFNDLSTSKKRPVLIVKAPNFQGDFIAVTITSQSGYEILWHYSKILYARIVTENKLVTLNKSLVIQRIGKLSDSAFARIHHAICLNINSSH